MFSSALINLLTVVAFNFDYIFNDVCNTNGEAEECMWDFGGKARKKETTRKT
jgi:hypothetical protein